MDELKKQVEDLDSQIINADEELKKVQTEIADINAAIGDDGTATDEQMEAMGSLREREITLLQDKTAFVMKQNALLKQIANIEADAAMNGQNKEEDK
jgi:chromosome segregation ATPase